MVNHTYIYIVLIVINSLYALPSVESVVRGSLPLGIFCFYCLVALILFVFRLCTHKANSSEFFCNRGSSGVAIIITMTVWLITLVGILTEVSFINYFCLTYCLSVQYPDGLRKKAGIFTAILMCSPTLIYTIYNNWLVHSAAISLIFVLMSAGSKSRGVKVSEVTQ